MTVKVLHNNFTRNVQVSDIKLSSNREFYIWNFVGEDSKKYTGFTPISAYYGGKLHRWYSLLAGYYLPESYTINLDTVMSITCIIVLGAKGVVKEIVPLQDSKKGVKNDVNFKQGEPDESIFGATG